MKPNELKRSIQLMRDLPPFICLIVVCAVSLFFIPWWASLALFATGYCVLGYLTYLHAIKMVRTLTGLPAARTRALYSAAITGDWSKIKDEELVVRPKPDSEFPWRKSKLQNQLATHRQDCFAKA